MLFPQLMNLAIRAATLLLAVSTVSSNPIHGSQNVESATTDLSARSNAALAARATFANREYTIYCLVRGC